MIILKRKRLALFFFFKECFKISGDYKETITGNIICWHSIVTKILTFQTIGKFKKYLLIFNK